MFLAVFVLVAVAIWWHGGMSSRDVFRLLGLCFACELIDSSLGMGYADAPIGCFEADLTPGVAEA